MIDIFCDLQSIINNFRQYNIGTSQVLKLQIYQKVEKLVKWGFRIFIGWILDNSKVEKNEWADKVVKKVAFGEKVHIAKYTSLTHVR